MTAVRREVFLSDLDWETLRQLADEVRLDTYPGDHFHVTRRGRRATAGRAVSNVIERLARATRRRWRDDSPGRLVTAGQSAGFTPASLAEYMRAELSPDDQPHSCPVCGVTDCHDFHRGAVVENSNNGRRWIVVRRSYRGTSWLLDPLDGRAMSYIAPGPTWRTVAASADDLT